MAGACDALISAETFEEAVANSQAHGMKMMGDPAHKAVMDKVMAMAPEDQKKMMEEVKSVWEAAPEA